MGGAETSAYNLAQWLKSRGSDVGVLTTAKKPEEELRGEELNGLKTWRVWMPRPYPMWDFPRSPVVMKPLWHLQDHIDPRNRRIMAQVVDAFQPDLVSIHIIQGLGYNSLLEIARREIPTAYFLHDLGLSCVRMSMFRKGANCVKQCAVCKASAAFKLRKVSRINNLAFCSPSSANLETLANGFPVKRWPTAVLLNANRYPKPTVARTESHVCRLLYAGRLHSSKGVALLLEAAEQVVETGKTLTVTLAGSGPEEAALKRRFGSHRWVKFLGFISQEQLSNEMINHELLCIPSIWAENSPGVVIHALSVGLPVVGSNRGGIPELVQDGVNGFILSENTVAAWQAALFHLVGDRDLIQKIKAHAGADAARFDQRRLAVKIESFLSGLLIRKNNASEE